MRPPRISFIGGIYHVVTRCNNRKFRIRNQQDFEAFLAILSQAKELYKVKVYGYCLCNNHVHLLIATPEKANLSKFMQYVNGNYAKAYNKAHGRTGRFWGGRFHSTVIESDTQFLNTLIYIELNMLRNGAVDDPEDWRWSSYRAHATGAEDPILDMHELYLELGDTPEQRQKVYREMIAQHIEEKGLRREPAYSSAVILGSKTFVESLLEEYAKIADYFKQRKPQEYENDVFTLLRIALAE